MPAGALELCTLPVFKLRRRALTFERAEQTARRLLGGTPSRIASACGRWQFALDDRAVDVDPISGAIWFEAAELWRPPTRRRPARPAKTPAADVSKWRDLVQVLVGPPADNGGITVTVDEAWRSGAHMAIWRDGVRTDCDLDLTISYTLTLRGAGLDDPVTAVGDGTKCAVMVNDAGELIGLNFTWPGIERIHAECPVVPIERLDLPGAEAHRRDLVYHLHEGGGDAYLTPQHRFTETVAPGDARVSFWPATTFEQDLRARDEQSSPGATIEDSRWPPGNRPRFFMSWLGAREGRLVHSESVRNQVVKTLTAAGWTRLDYGEQQALKSDWTTNGSSGVGAADLAWYCGHATGDSLDLIGAAGRVDSLSSGECRFGQPRLKWIVVDACGPLQDERTCLATSVFDRWQPAFDGLHSLLGFATDQLQNDRQSPLAMAYALEGVPIARAWFKACCQRQSNARGKYGRPPVAAGLFVIEGDRTTLEDCLPGCGPALDRVARNPRTLLALFVPVA